MVIFNGNYIASSTHTRENAIFSKTNYYGGVPWCTCMAVYGLLAISISPSVSELPDQTRIWGHLFHNTNSTVYACV